MKTDLDLLPPKIRRRLSLKKQLLEKVVTLGKNLILGLEAVSLLLLLLNLGLAFELKKTEKEIFKKQAFLKGKQKIEKEIRHFQAKNLALAAAEKNRRSYIRLLDILAQLRPREVAFSTLWLGEKGHLRITARAATGLSFARLVDRLLSSQVFKEVILTESEFLPKEKVYRFSISVPTIAETVFR